MVQIALTFILLGLGLTQSFANDILETLYKNRNGFSITSDETKLVEKDGGNATYGEITDKGVQIIIDSVKPTDKDVFYDLGSGVGRMVVKMYLDSPVAKSIGIELSPTRNKQALEVKKELEVLGKVSKDRLLEFWQEDIRKANINDATIIYLASTCFSDMFMQTITAMCSRLQKGLKLLTLQKLPENKVFTYIKELYVPMTWSEKTLVHWYELR